MLAIFSEVRLVAAFWLRPGNCSCANNVVGFFLDLWENLPSHLRLRVVRADSGFYVGELLRLWEQLWVKFIVVARLTRPVQSLLRRETCWLATGLDGTEVCRLIRSRPATSTLPIIMLTARTEESDRVLGLDLGADDYITKPFSPRELAARVRAVLRRKATAQPSAMSLYRGSRIVADFDAVSVTVDGEPVRLTRREFELLRCLVENRNRVLSRERLLVRVWGYDQSIETRSVDVHVGRLRSKLRTAGPQIETVVGLGYRFIE